MLKLRNKLVSLIPHFISVLIAMYYAWMISQSAYVKTGLQFVAPLLIIMVIHLAWSAFRNELTQGFFRVVVERTASTSVAIAGMVILASIFAPMPAQANGILEGIAHFFAMAMCLAVLALVVAVPALILFFLVKSSALAINSLSRDKSKDNDSRMMDAGGLMIVLLMLGAASLEGVTSTYSFAQKGSSTAIQRIEATPATVWETLEVATSPKFPLSQVLHIFPQPVAILKDEGVGMDAMRVVRIEGREGAGNLTLRVTERDQTSVKLSVVSDTSPIANWIRHKSITYTVLPDGDGTNLSVTLEYDRLLSPAWFFDPAMKLSAHLAMDVLARDVRTRSENGS